MCDNKSQFNGIDISNPVSTSDYLALDISPICKLLETPGYLAEWLSIYGDNACINSAYTEEYLVWACSVSAITGF